MGSWKFPLEPLEKPQRRRQMKLVQEPSQQKIEGRKMHEKI